MSRPFPFEPARDLLGILRAIYMHEKSRAFPSKPKLQLVERLAKDLADAMMSAESHDPGTAPYERALSRAEGVAFHLADIVSVVDPLEPILKVAGDRVHGRRPKEIERRFQWSTGRRRG